MEAISLSTAMDTHITDFIERQTVMTLATTKDNIPHCAMCFYVFVKEHNLLVFKSKPSTQHVEQALINNAVSGTVLPDKLIPAKTSGIQFYGTFCKDDEQKHSLAAHYYYRKYPFAAGVAGELWIIELTKIVFTDATLGFGKKRTWVNCKQTLNQPI